MRGLSCLALGASSVCLSGGAWAEEPREPIELSLSYVAGVTGVVDGGLRQRGRFLDNLNLTADIDLEAMFDWRGATARFDVLNNSGGAPNDDAGTLQGVDNIEVTRQRLRLFEAWVEQAWGASSLRVGLYDLNSEFYANESAGYLIAPAFGIGSEIAATGPNGPSIFPSTALGARYNINFDGGGFLRGGVINAAAGVLGDPDGVDTSFDEGALLIGEGGVEAAGLKFSIGAWRYTRRQDDIREVDGLGAPLRRIAQGAYLIYERTLNEPGAEKETSVFFRAGVSEGETSPFVGGWQSGVLVRHVFQSRANSVFSVGVNQGVLSDGYRRNQIDLGSQMEDAELQFEMTYSDTILPNVTIQPDIQWIPTPGGDKSIDGALILGLRVGVEL